MRIPSGSLDLYMNFQATLNGAAVTGLSGFTVARSRNGAAAVAWTTPTIVETSSSLQPGVYALLMDEGTTLDAGHDYEELVVYITKTGMDFVSRTVELVRPKITAGETLTVSSGLISNTTAIDSVASVTAIAANAVNASALATDAVAEIQSGLATAANLATVAGYLDTEIAAILQDTGTDIPAQIAALNNLSAAQVNTEVDTALADYDAPTNTEMVAAFTQIKGATWASTDTLENIRDELVAVDTVVDAILVDTGTDIPAMITTIDDFLDTEIAAIVTSTGTTIPAALTVIDDFLDTEIAAIKAKTDNLPTDPADASDIAAAFSTVNGTLATVAGYIDTEVAAIKAKTDLIPAAPAAVGDIPTALQNADALLNRDMSAVSDTTARSPLNALRLLRNKYSIAAGTLTVTKEDDTTSAWTAAVTTDAAADPITGADPT